ncbi:MAG: glycerol kinase GlpK [Cyanobacteria bacterium NC_groundwater_1444_Ag_S-0.65um_54_12]|nr:glycerol kinase GlpK [Cyanobacteria bacterium NC_groundwater_1444_Ag_S-0.65um_54_12]
MTEQMVLAIDQGTTGTTVLIFDAAGQVRGRGYREITQYYPQPGWVEHDAIEIWHRTQEAIATTLAMAGITSNALVAIGITNQRETTVIWERSTGRPIAPAIVWQCRRTAPACDRLRADGHAELIRRKTGLVLDAYFSATKIAWLLDHVPDARKRAEAGDLAFGTIDSWLVWNLTGGEVHVTDPANASRTLLFDLRHLTWDQELCALFGVPFALLPTIWTNSGVAGRTVATGPLAAGIPIAGMAGDQQAALFGQGCFAPGAAKNTYGTGCFLLVNTGNVPIYSQHGLLATVAWQIADQTVYALEGSVFVGGAVIQWLRDDLGLIAEAAESEALALGVPDNGGIYLVPAFVGLGAPYWDPYARGAIFGLTRGTTRAQLARAALEAIAYQTTDLIGGVIADTGEPLRFIKADGGAAVNDFLMQFQADVLNLPIHRGAQVESTARGAAYLAGLGAGVWPDLASLPLPGAERVFSATMSESERQALLAGWHKAVERSRHWIA